jgi:hypothetical protein
MRHVLVDLNNAGEIGKRREPPRNAVTVDVGADMADQYRSGGP